MRANCSLRSSRGVIRVIGEPPFSFMWTPSTIAVVVDTVHFFSLVVRRGRQRTSWGGPRWSGGVVREAAVRDGLVAAGVELARTGGPDAVVLREATRMVGVVPNAGLPPLRRPRRAIWPPSAQRRCANSPARMAAGVARVPGKYGDREPRPAAGLRAVGAAYLEFAREEPGLFATAFARTAATRWLVQDPPLSARALLLV